MSHKDSGLAPSRTSPQSPEPGRLEYPLVRPDAQWEFVATVDDAVVLEGLCWHQGTLWFIDVVTSRIFRMDGTRVETVYEDARGLAHPNGMRFIDHDTALICDRAQGLCTFTVSTGAYEVRASSCQGVPFRALNDLALDGHGGAYFTDPGPSNYLREDGVVYHVDYASGEFACERFAANIAYPNGIAVSPDGMFVYIAEFDSNSIICAPSRLYDDGLETPHVFARLVGGHGPDGILTDDRGRLYSAHLGAKEVAVNDEHGWPLPSIRLPVDAQHKPTNLLIADGHLYVSEIIGKSIWRIAIDARPNPLAVV